MNKGSKKVLTRNGFKIEGKFKSEAIYRGRRVNTFWLGKIL